MTISAAILFFACPQAFAYDGFGFGVGFGQYLGPAYAFGYGPAYGFGSAFPVFVPCGSGPYGIAGGQIVCTRQ